MIKVGLFVAGLAGAYLGRNAPEQSGGDADPYEGIGRIKLESGGYFLLENGGFLLTEK